MLNSDQSWCYGLKAWVLIIWFQDLKSLSNLGYLLLMLKSTLIFTGISLFMVLQFVLPMLAFVKIHTLYTYFLTASTTIFITCILFSRDWSFIDIMKKLFKRSMLIESQILVLIHLKTLSPLSSQASMQLLLLWK